MILKKKLICRCIYGKLTGKSSTVRGILTIRDGWYVTTLAVGGDNSLDLHRTTILLKKLILVKEGT